MTRNHSIFESNQQIQYAFAFRAAKRALHLADTRERGILLESFSEAWGYICAFCKSKITDVAYNSWFERLVPVSLDFDKGLAIIEAPNEFHKNTVIRCYSELLNEAFESVFGSKLEYTIVLKDHSPVKREVLSDTNYDSDLTFDNFVVGSSNRFAQAACVAVSTQPATLYNPLFIYGNSGLGKTHLLYAISYEIRNRFPNMVIQYVKGDGFTIEMIEAIQKGTTSVFREKYRYADVLLVDDIQFIAGKDSTQEEFFHTFNALYEDNKQIILTSDRPPKDISTLEDRLKSRFEWGLTADIQPPDFETRIAIINRKAESIQFEIPDNVCEFIANKLKSNIRQLEGAVKKLKAYHMVEAKPINIATAQAAISDIINNSQPTLVTVDNIIEEVGRFFEVSPEDIRSQKRNSKISQARQIAMYVVRDITQLPMISIGETFGGRDHSTVVYAMRQVEKNIDKDPRTKAIVTDIIKNIRDR